MVESWGRLVWTVLILSVLVACSSTESQPDPTLIPAQNPTQIPESTNAPEPTSTPLPTETPEPTATIEPVLQPDLEATFDMETCTQEPYGGKPSIISFSSEVIPEGGYLVALADKLNKEFYSQTQAPAGFDIDPILYGAWSHFSQQTDGPAVDSNGITIPLGVLSGSTGHEQVYDVCLSPSSYGPAPDGVSLMKLEPISIRTIQDHCENDHGIIKDGFFLFDRNNRPTVEITESTTVSQFLAEHEPALCYGIKHDSFNNPGWIDGQNRATIQQMVTAHFLGQSGEVQPLPYAFGEQVNGYPLTPNDAIIPPGKYEFYSNELNIPCSDEEFSMVPPISDGNSCYHFFGETMANDSGGTYRHLGIDYRVTGTGFASADGIVTFAEDSVNELIGGEVMINHGCHLDVNGNPRDFVSVYGHSFPLVEKGDVVKKGDPITVTGQWDEIELQLYSFTPNPGANYTNSSRQESKAVDPALYLPPFTCTSQ